MKLKKKYSVIFSKYSSNIKKGLFHFSKKEKKKEIFPYKRGKICLEWRMCVWVSEGYMG